MPQRICFAYAVTLLAAVGNLDAELVLTRPQSHQHFDKWHASRHPAGAPASRLQTALCSLQQHKHPDSKAPIDILQPHQHPGPKAHTKDLADRSLKAQLVAFDYAGVKPSNVFDVSSLVFQRAEGRFWTVQCVEYGLIRTWAGGQSAHPSLRGASAQPTRSLRLSQGPPGRSLVKHSAQARALLPLQQQAGGKRRTSRLQLAWTASGLSCPAALV